MPGTIEFKTTGEHYFLEKETMLRLIARNLKKEEYFALINKHGQSCFLLHDDFYPNQKRVPILIL